MGAGASTGAAVIPSAEDVGKWSKEEVGEQVASFGEAFEEYKIPFLISLHLNYN